MTGIEEITWAMGPPMPYPTKGQAQGVIGNSIVAAAGVAPNFDVLVFDTVEETYATLPTRIPPYVTREPEQQVKRLPGRYRARRRRGSIYMCGAEVISNCNVTDEVVIGTIVPCSSDEGGLD